MSPTTQCPACGATIEYTGSDAIVQCDFCNSHLHIAEDDNGPRVELVDRPSPQADLLSERGAAAASESLAEALEDAAGPVASGPVSTSGPVFSQDLEDFSGIRNEVDIPPGEPVAPGYATQGSMGADASNLFPEAASAFPPPSATTIPSTPTYQEGRIEDAGQEGAGKRPVWIPIVIGVVLFLCLACACMVGAVLILFPNGEFTL